MTEIEQVESLVAKVVGDESRAWHDLMAALEPLLLKLASRQKIGRLRANEDAQRDICVRVLEKFFVRDHRVLREYMANPQRPPFKPWLRVVVRRSAIDYMRAQKDYRRNASGSKRWVSVVTLTSAAQAPGVASIVAKRAEVVRLLQDTLEDVQAEAEHGIDHSIKVLSKRWKVSRLMARRVVRHGARFSKTLELLIQGHGYGEIAEKLGLTHREVGLTLGYMEEFLAARFESAGDPG